MFSIYEKVPVYNDRDAVSHSEIRKVSAYNYETSALALRLMPSSYDEFGQCKEVDYFVADSSDPWKRVAPPAGEWQDIEIPW